MSFSWNTAILTTVAYLEQEGAGVGVVERRWGVRWNSNVPSLAGWSLAGDLTMTLPLICGWRVSKGTALGYCKHDS